MSNEELLKAGIAAAQAGDIDRAAGFFAELVSADPSSDQGWLMLGMCLPASDRRGYCLRRALAINPNNAEAQRQLDRIPEPGGSAPRAAPARDVSPAIFPGAAREMEKPQWSRTVELPNRVPAGPAPSERSAYGFEEELRQEEPTPPFVDMGDLEESRSPLPKSKPVARAAGRKKTNKALIAVLVLSVATLAVCGVGAGYLVLSGGAASLLAPAFVEIPTALRMPSAAATQPGAVAAASSATSAPPTALPTFVPTVSYTPSFEASDCRFDVPSHADVTCGFLIVPENRAGDPSHTIRLAVAIYHSTSANPEPEPVLFLQGGPGGEAVKLSAQAYRLLVAPFLSRRDFIAYDQRGTGLSEPSLNCDDLTKAYLQDIYGQIPADARKLVYSNAFVSCQGLMSAKGINLNSYTTVDSAADVKDLLAVLNYKQADLYGASYGTRLAQVIMRDEPGIVHSVVLDSVVPIETNFFRQYPDSIQFGLKRLFDSCAADAACNAAYPNLEAVFWDQVSRLDAKPVPLTVANPQTGSISENVDGSVLLNIVLGSLKQSSLIETAPQTIYRFKAGDYSTVLAAETSLPFAFQDISAGLFISMMCHEHVLATTPEQLQSATSGPADIREYAWLPFYGSAQDVFRICQQWRAAGPRLGENDPVQSDIPTLIITGKFDPTTPPQYAQQVAAHLSHSYYFEFPNQGHTPTAADTSGCAMSTVVAFLDNPLAEPDHACLDEIAPVAYVLPYTGDPAVKLKAANPLGLSARVPKDWLTETDGFYVRGNSPLDITQIGILPVPGTSSEDVLKWLSMKAWGYRGLDAAPVWAGQRHANGLDWTLYTSSSYGRPVDIAMADHGKSSIVVLAFSNIDEHDALYKTVFLPIVDSVSP